jgi:hypothetical protein
MAQLPNPGQKAGNPSPDVAPAFLRWLLEQGRLSGGSISDSMRRVEQGMSSPGGMGEAWHPLQAALGDLLRNLGSLNTLQLAQQAVQQPMPQQPVGKSFETMQPQDLEQMRRLIAQMLTPALNPNAASMLARLAGDQTVVPGFLPSLPLPGQRGPA